MDSDLPELESVPSLNPPAPAPAGQAADNPGTIPEAAAAPRPTSAWLVLLIGALLLAGGYLLAGLATVILFGWRSARLLGHGSAAAALRAGHPGFFLLLILLLNLFPLLFFLLAAGMSRLGWRQRLGLLRPRLAPRHWPLIILGTFTSAGIGSSLSFAASLVGLHLPRDTGTTSLVSAFMALPAAWKILMYIDATALTGLTEELYMRGYIQRGLLRRWSPWAALPVTGVFFAALHGWPHALSVLPLALWLGYLAWRTESILPGMVCHACQNGLALASLAVFWHPGKVVAESTPVPNGPTIVAFLVGTAIAVWILAAVVFAIEEHRRKSLQPPIVAAVTSGTAPEA